MSKYVEQQILELNQQVGELYQQGRYEEAFDAFYKATWNGAWGAASYFELSRLASRAGRLEEALESAHCCGVRCPIGCVLAMPRCMLLPMSTNVYWHPMRSDDRSLALILVWPLVRAWDQVMATGGPGQYCVKSMLSARCCPIGCIACMCRSIALVWPLALSKHVPV